MFSSTISFTYASPTLKLKVIETMVSKLSPRQERAQLQPQKTNHLFSCTHAPKKKGPFLFWHWLYPIPCITKAQTLICFFPLAKARRSLYMLFIYHTFLFHFLYSSIVKEHALVKAFLVNSIFQPTKFEHVERLIDRLKGWHQLDGDRLCSNMQFSLE